MTQRSGAFAAQPVQPISREIAMPKLEDDVRGAFGRANGGSGTPDELLAAVRVLVRDLRAAGQPPEIVLITIKQLCGLPLAIVAADTDASADPSQTKQISDMMVRAAIDEYYMKRRAPTSPDSQGKGTGDLSRPR
jgi:hypothetical protein